MAAATVAIKRTSSALHQLTSNRTLEQDKILPQKKFWRADLHISVLLNRKWQKRRVVYTKEYIYICNTEDEVVRDLIPLSEVMQICELDFKDDFASPHSIRKGFLVRQNSNVFFANHAIVVSTISDGYNSGRKYSFQTQSVQACECLLVELKKLARDARKKREGRTRFQNSQIFVRRIVNSTAFQYFITAIILSNFILCIITANAGEDQPSTPDNVSDSLNLFFTVAFTAELLLTLYGKWLLPFFCDGWCLLDLVTVLLSLTGLAPVGLPVGIILSLRAVRVIRLFGKIKSMKKIITAITCSLVPMANAFGIIFIFTAIYAIVSVNLFRDDDPANFGAFPRAFITMFRVTAGDPFVAGLCYYPDGSVHLEFVLFFFSFILVVILLLLQVSIAVLLESFLAASSELESQEAGRGEADPGETDRNPLDPLLARLAQSYVDNNDLSEKLNKLFFRLDHDESGEITSSEFCVAMRKLDIHLSDSDFMSITRNGTLCDPAGNLGPVEFQAVMRDQLRLYTQSCLRSADLGQLDSGLALSLSVAMKQMLVDQTSAYQRLEALGRDMVELGDIFRRRVRADGSDADADRGAGAVRRSASGCSGQIVPGSAESQCAVGAHTRGLPSVGDKGKHVGVVASSTLGRGQAFGMGRYRAAGKGQGDSSITPEQQWGFPPVHPSGGSVCVSAASVESPSSDSVGEVSLCNPSVTIAGAWPSNFPHHGGGGNSPRALRTVNGQGKLDLEKPQHQSAATSGGGRSTSPHCHRSRGHGSRESPQLGSLSGVASKGGRSRAEETAVCAELEASGFRPVDDLTVLEVSSFRSTSDSVLLPDLGAPISITATINAPQTGEAPKPLTTAALTAHPPGTQPWTPSVTAAARVWAMAPAGEGSGDCSAPGFRSPGRSADPRSWPTGWDCTLRLQEVANSVSGASWAVRRGRDGATNSSSDLGVEQRLDGQPEVEVAVAGHVAAVAPKLAPTRRSSPPRKRFRLHPEVRSLSLPQL